LGDIKAVLETMLYGELKIFLTSFPRLALTVDPCPERSAIGVL
jgi:hypothetical protein